MICTIDELTPIMHESNATLLAALIGVFGALLGVIATSVIENKRRRKDLNDKAKPIIINYQNTETLTSKTCLQ